VSAALISIIGPPAAGKTTLAERLCQALPAQLIREDYAGNPFLVDACLGRAEARLPSQLYFLLSRVGQLGVANWPAKGTFVTDYGFCQDRVYARASLAAGDLRLYGRVAGRVEGLVHPPGLLIALDASEATLLDRIARRGRDFEKVMTAGFLSGIRRAYNQIAAQSPCPVIRVDCETTDLREEAALAQLIQGFAQK